MHKKSSSFKKPDLSKVAEMVAACIQCGTCSGTCPNAFAMEHPPRKLWRMVLMGQWERVMQSTTFALCSVCFHCTLRCPRGLPLTEAMSQLKQAAFAAKAPVFASSTAFYASFLKSIAKNGRVNEMELMTRYFRSMKNPLEPLRFTSLGLRLIGRGKIKLFSTAHKKISVKRLFESVGEAESP